MNPHDKEKMRGYYDDLGGAYYFRPPGLDKPIRAPFWLHGISFYIDGLFWIIVLIVAMLLL